MPLVNNLLPIVVGLLGFGIARVFRPGANQPRRAFRPILVGFAVALSLLTLYLSQLASQISSVLDTEAAKGNDGSARISLAAATGTPSPFATRSVPSPAGKQTLTPSTRAAASPSQVPAGTLQAPAAARRGKPQARAATSATLTPRATGAAATVDARPADGDTAREQQEEIEGGPLPQSRTTPAASPTRASAARDQISPTKTGAVERATPAPSTTASPTRAADEVYEHLITAKDGLQSGRLEATIDYSDGSCSVVTARFDFGDRSSVASLHRTTVHTSAKGKQMYERITIGDQTWERKLGSKWVKVPTTEGVRELIEALLPTTEANQQTVVSGDEEVAFVYWYDRQRDVSVTVDVQRVTGMPLAFHEWNEVTNMVVEYRDWNRPVTIKPPSDK